MSVFGWIYDVIDDSGYFLKSEYSLKTKIRIFLNWLKINSKNLLLNRFFNFRTEFIFGFKIAGLKYRLIRNLYEGIFFRNEYFFKTKKKNPLILDCGANIGLSTIFFKWLYSKSKVYAFEPDKASFELLKRNLQINNLKDAYAFNYALSNKNGKISFYIDQKNQGSLIMSTRPERTPNRKKVTVDAIKLSAFIKKYKIKHIDFLKMDIEGSEVEVFADLEKEKLLKQIETMAIEYHHKIGSEKSRLANFLKRIEDAGFEYKINAVSLPIYADKFQDIFIYAYRK